MTLKWTIWTSLHSIIFKFNGLQIRSCATSSCRHPPRFVPLVLSSPHTYYHLQEASWELIHRGNGSQWGGLEAGLWWRGRPACIKKKNEWMRKEVGKQGEGGRAIWSRWFPTDISFGVCSDPTEGLGDSLRLSGEGKELGNPAWLAQAWVYFLVVVLYFFPKLLMLRQRNPQEVKCWRITEAVKVSTWLVVLRSPLHLVTCTWPLLIGPNNV